MILNLRPLCLLTLCATAYGQRMVADLSPGPEPTPRLLRFLGAAGTREILLVGDQLWTTDGMPGGAQPLAEFAPNILPWGGVSFGMRLVMPTLLDQGSGLWQTDGASSGLLTLIAPPRRGAHLSDLLSLGNRAVFAAQEDVHGTELWVTDGTAVGTHLLSDIRPGVEGSWPGDLARADGVAYFLADDGVHGRELWRTDGTAAGTFMVADLVPGPLGVGGLQQMIPVPGGLLFPFGSTLWFTDGSSGSVHPGVSVPATARSFAPLGRRILFQVGSDLWSTDGSAAGTRLVRSFQGLVLLRRGRVTYDAPVELGGNLLFLASDGVTGFELWRSDGTANGTGLVVDLAPGALGSWPEPLFAEGTRAWLLADAGPEGKELWTTDGTATGTRLVADMTPGSVGSRVDAVAVLPGMRLLAVGDGTGGAARVWGVDQGGAREVVSPIFAPRGTEVLQLVPADEDAALRIVAPTGYEILRVAADGQFTRLGAGDRLATSVDEIAFLRGPDLVVHDRVAGARVAFTFPGSSQFGLAGVNRLWFVSILNGASFEVWRSDGTAAGTSFLTLGTFYQAVAMGHRAVLSSPLGLHVTDGTAGGTSFVPVPTTGAPEHLAPFGGQVVFTLHGREIWTSDGSPAGTRLVATLPTTTALRLVAGARRMFALSQTELFVSDGTAAGTRPVRRFPVASTDDLVVIDDRAFFAATEAATGDEIWVSDGTASGTTVLDLQPGPLGSSPRALSAIGDRLAFAASEPAFGRELWVSDGTLAGSARVADLHPGFVGSWPARIVRAGASLFFMADDGSNGFEPWLAPLSLSGAAAVDGLAGACAGPQGPPRVTSGYARLGDLGFGLSVSAARASAPGVLLVGTHSAAVRLGDCVQRVAPLVALGLQMDATGSARVAAPVPSTPSLLGQPLVWQALLADPQGPLFGLASLSDGWRTVIGR